MCSYIKGDRFVICSAILSATGTLFFLIVGFILSFQRNFLDFPTTDRSNVASFISAGVLNIIRYI